MWEFPKIRGALFGDPYNKDYSILGSILGSPYFGKLPCSCGRSLVSSSGLLGSFHFFHKGPSIQTQWFVAVHNHCDSSALCQQLRPIARATSVAKDGAVVLQ